MNRSRRRQSEVVLAVVTVVVVVTVALCAAWAGDRLGRAQAMTADGRVVYLTFDDGPSPGYTREVLADLNAAGAHATFFQIGQNMTGECQLMRQMVAEGEQLGTHSWDHPRFDRLTPAQAAAEIGRARAAQVACTGHDSRLFRYPYDQPSAAGAAYLGGQRMLAIDAGINPGDWDWPKVTDAQIIARVMAQVRPGVIIQLHDGQDVLGRDRSHPGYLPGLLAALKQAGYAMVTLPSQPGPAGE